MDEASPARLYATLIGAALTIYGIAGFFFDASFDRPEDIGDAAGLLAVNGWANCLHVLSGALGLLVAGFAARTYVVAIVAFYGAVALLGAA